MYVWPCAPVLAQYVWHKREWIQGKKVLEIGAGTSLPGVMAAKCGALVTLSDDCQQPRSLENCRQSCRANGLAACEVIGLTWGRVSPAVVTLGKVDVILASDCFYDTKDFEDVLFTFRYFIDKNQDTKCWVSYQERSSDRSIEPLLKKWHLSCSHIPLCLFSADSPTLGNSSLPGNHTIRMMEITAEASATNST
ncbi:histone-arginine methyltransferase METTL23-like [Diadema antillarum]|uniref:histone-arginine methyltransferase METTL23-like n=1 Tax=Diadema antillarum TaxID=105358 RepID=UPI003A88B8D7